MQITNKAELIKLKAALRTKNDKVLVRFLEDIYAQGFSDGAKAEPIDMKTRYVPVKENTSYEVICPHCGETIVLDLKDFADQEAKNPIVEETFKEKTDESL